jgi:tetratricopeptide (TPR) repeat protein
MFKSRLSSWEVGKNITRQDWLYVAILLRERRQAGKTRSTINVRKKSKTMKDYCKFLKDHGMSEADLLAEATVPESDAVPPYIRCVTPDDSSTSTGRGSGYAKRLQQATSDDSEPPILNAQQSSSSKSSSNGPHSGKMSAFVQLQLNGGDMPFPSERNGASAMLRTDGSSESFEELSSQYAPSTSQHGACDRLQQDFRTMVAQTSCPDRLQSFAPNLGDLPAWSMLSPCPSPGFLEETCSKCGVEIAKHDPIPKDFLSASAADLANKYQPLDLGVEMRDYSIFTAACMSACVYGVKGDYDVLAECLSRATGVYKQMLLNNDPWALVGVNMALIWLHAHEQGPMAGSIIRSVLRVALSILDKEHPITTTLEWMTSVAFKKQKECHIQTSKLRDVYTKFRTSNSHGFKHQHTIVALYNLGYNLIQDKKYEEAERHLYHLVEISTQTLGASSLQTVAALNALSRAQSWQGNYGLAKETLEKGLQHAPLGENHPYRLESVRRRAYLLKKLGRVAEEEPLRRQVLRGRVATLGPQHPSSQNAREDLVDLLKELGKWEGEEEFERLLETAPIESQDKKEDEDLWRRVVVEGV